MQHGALDHDGRLLREQRDEIGAPARAIQELAGDADLRTTQRYMHLSPAALESAIRLLERRDFGDIGETEGAGSRKSL